MPDDFRQQVATVNAHIERAKADLARAVRAALPQIQADFERVRRSFANVKWPEKPKRG